MLLEKWMGWTYKPRFLGAKNFPRVALHEPTLVVVDHIMNLSEPAIDIGSLAGFIGDTPKASCASDAGFRRSFIGRDLDAGKHMGR